MKGLLFVVALSACALARPDIGLKLREGYNYKPPSTNYGVPSGSYLPSAPSSNYVAPHDHHTQNNQQQHFEHNYHGEHTHHGPNNYASNVPQHHEYQQHHTSHQPAGHYDGQFEHHPSGQNQYNNFASHQSGVNTYSHAGPAQVQKHVYFYDAPEELPAPQIRFSAQASAPQINHRVIFIKAPTYKAPQFADIPVQNQHQEKTVVYVLVKKPEEGADIVVPTAAPASPSKPEVYFIKYKSQKDAEEAINQIQQGSNSGISANSVESHNDLISTIQDTPEHHHHQDHIIHNHHDSSSNVIETAGHHDDGHHNNHDNAGHHHHEESFHHHDATPTIRTVTTSGNYGPAGASGPY